MKKLLIICLLMIGNNCRAQTIFDVLYSYNFICNKQYAQPFVVNFTANNKNVPAVTRKFIGFSGISTYTMTTQMGWKDVMFKDNTREILITFDTVYDNNMREVLGTSFSMRELGPGINFTSHCGIM